MKKPYRSTIAASSALSTVLWACGSGVDHGEQLNAMVEEYYEEYLTMNPITATSIGDHRYDDQFANSLSEQFRTAALDLERRYLEAATDIDPESLGDQDHLTYDLFVYGRNLNIESYEFPSHLIPMSQFFSTPNFFATLGSGKSLHPFKTVQNYDDFLSRMDGFLEWMDQAIANMRIGMERGLVQPRVLMERSLPQLEAHVVDNAEESIFWGPINDMPDSIPEADRNRLADAYRTAITDKLVPAYARLHDFIRDEYMPRTREIAGIGGVPGGDDWYAYLVRSRTTTALSPSEIHDIGLAEVARIHEEMQGVMDEVGFEGDRDAFFDFVSTDPQFHFESKEAMLAAYEGLREDVDSKALALFERFPNAGYEIRPVEPFRERSFAGGSYQAPSPDGTRPGVFYVNTYDLSSRPIWDMESLFLHEAVPGHHFQIALARELEELPRFRRFGSFTAYTEGWGLYAESLGKELGVYQDPYQYFGGLNAELWRAIRLVVDTGLHEKGWTREQVIDYMLENSATGETTAIAEAERYMAIPGQALAYKIGQLKIRELRNRAEAALGDRFDVREFHSQVLNDGPLPMSVLEAKIDRWIVAQSD